MYFISVYLKKLDHCFYGLVLQILNIEINYKFYKSDSCQVLTKIHWDFIELLIDTE